MIRYLFVTCVALSAVAPSHACGPIFPTMYAVSDLTHTVVSMPRGSFAYELVRLTGVTPPRVSPPAVPAAEREAEELCQALRAAGADPAETAEAVSVYQAVRSAKILPNVDPLSPLHVIPREFLLYAEGACHYHRRQWPEALAAWESLLSLPPAQRQYRSTWAAYMRGKVYLNLLLESSEDWNGPVASGAESDAAIACFEKTRQLAAEGFADVLHLSWSSLGDQARAAFLTEDYLGALRGYLEQYRTPTPHPDHSVTQSLQWTLARMLRQPAEQLAQYAADPDAAPALTAYVLSRRPDPTIHAGWVTAVANAGQPASPGNASRLAWMAYRNGEIDTARRLLSTTEQLDPMAHWLQAKLALWDGDIDRAAAILESLADPDAASVAASGAPMHGMSWAHHMDRPFVDGELGLLYLARSRYDLALDRFLRGGLWADAAYVAERVMTVQELETYVANRRASVDEPVAQRPLYGYGYMRGTARDSDQRLAHLLARRWMRAGNRNQALKWFPEFLQAGARELDQWLTEAEDSTRSREDRALAQIKAAHIMREQGMELFGAELDPDWSMYGGSYHLGDAAQSRLQRDDRSASPTPAALLQPSGDERDRVSKRDVANSLRFHYRKLAADMMWEAAQALPDNDLRTAEALYFGGSYLKNKYPQEADRFYKALVNRCRRLPIGEEADRLRWFPRQFP